MVKSKGESRKLQCHSPEEASKNLITTARRKKMEYFLIYLFIFKKVNIEINMQEV